jgi:iron complex outermembrane recepter protein
MFVYLLSKLFNMKRKILFTLLIVALATNTFAQSFLKGKIVETATNRPLVGATIVFGKATTTSDTDGLFTIECNKADNIFVSFVGYETQRKFIKNCDAVITIALNSSGKNLDEVEISATSNQNKSLLQSPSSITKLSAIELKRGNGLFFDDAINGNVPGVIMQRRAVSSGQQFNIRGYGNGTRGTRGVSSNFDGQGSKVYLNGIPITDAEGITTMDDIDFASIGNVEITKGPAGSLYGLAIAGAVNLSTIKPEQGKSFLSQEVLLGNYGLQRYTTTLGIAKEKSSLLLNYGHQKSDGFNIHNASKKDFINFVGNFLPNAKQNINTYVGYSNSYDERVGEDSVLQFLNNLPNGNTEYIRRNAHSGVYTVRAGVGHTYNFNNNISNTTTIFGTAFNSNVSSAGGWTDKATTNFGIRSTFNTNFNLAKGIGLSGITGIEAQKQIANTIGYTMLKDARDTANTWALGNPYYYIIGAANANLFAISTTASIFSEWTLALKNDFTFTAGIGVSNMKINLDDRFYVATQPNKVRQFEKLYNNLISPHFAINKVFNKRVSAYISFSKGYKAPTSSFFYAPAIGTTYNGGVNNDLTSEEGNQFEIGTKGELFNKKLNFQLAYFNAIFSNKFTAIAVPNPGATATLYTYTVNGGKQDHKGFEALIKYTAYKSNKGFIKNITLFTNLTYSNFKYKNYSFQTVGKSINTPQKDSALVFDYSNNAVAGVPKIIGNIGIDVLSNSGIYFNLNYYYKDKMTITGDGVVKINGVNTFFEAPSYSLLNAKIGYQKSLSKHFDIDVNFGAQNITNTLYPIMVFVNQIPDAFLKAPDKATYAGGVTVKYNF